MDYGFFEDENLLEVFRQNKTKISTIEKPLTFLRHLKDNGLITDELYKKLQKHDYDNGVYDALEYIQTHGTKKVRHFWKCVDQEHILQRYPQLSEIIATLKKSLCTEPNNKIREIYEDRGTGKEREGIEKSSESNQAGPSSQVTVRQKKKAKHMERALSREPNNKIRERYEDQGTGKEREEIEKSSESNQAGPSSQVTDRLKKKAKHMRDLQSSPDSTTETESFAHPSLKEEVNLWDKPKHKRWLPVTCGDKKALIDRVALSHRKRDCIKHNGKMISPYTFEKMGDKEAHKSWKTSILCQGKTLKSLMEMEILKIPKVEGKFTLRK